MSVDLFDGHDKRSLTYFDPSPVPFLSQTYTYTQRERVSGGQLKLIMRMC